jgi:hypothetical protein
VPGARPGPRIGSEGNWAAPRRLLVEAPLVLIGCEGRLGVAWPWTRSRGGQTCASACTAKPQALVPGLLVRDASLPPTQERSIGSL